MPRSDRIASSNQSPRDRSSLIGAAWMVPSDGNLGGKMSGVHARDLAQRFALHWDSLRAEEVVALFHPTDGVIRIKNAPANEQTEFRGAKGIRDCVTRWMPTRAKVNIQAVSDDGTIKELTFDAGAESARSDTKKVSNDRIPNVNQAKEEPSGTGGQRLRDRVNALIKEIENQSEHQKFAREHLLARVNQNLDRIDDRFQRGLLTVLVLVGIFLLSPRTDYVREAELASSTEQQTQARGTSGTGDSSEDVGTNAQAETSFLFSEVELGPLKLSDAAIVYKLLLLAIAFLYADLMANTAMRYRLMNLQGYLLDGLEKPVITHRLHDYLVPPSSMTVTRILTGEGAGLARSALRMSRDIYYVFVVFTPIPLYIFAVWKFSDLFGWPRDEGQSDVVIWVVAVISLFLFAQGFIYARIARENKKALSTQ